jgi:hypothetical protein
MNIKLAGIIFIPPGFSFPFGLFFLQNLQTHQPMSATTTKTMTAKIAKIILRNKIIFTSNDLAYCFSVWTHAIKKICIALSLLSIKAPYQKFTSASNNRFIT